MKDPVGDLVRNGPAIRVRRVLRPTKDVVSFNQIPALSRRTEPGLRHFSCRKAPPGRPRQRTSLISAGKCAETPLVLGNLVEGHRDVIVRARVGRARKTVSVIFLRIYFIPGGS